MSLTKTVQYNDTRRRPNILFVLVDDVGLEVPLTQLAARHAEMGINTGTFGFPVMTTLQSWADAGVVFDDVWTASRCSPTRSQCLTGRYAFRTGVGIVVREDELPTITTPSSGEFGNQGIEDTLPRILRVGPEGDPARYDCAHVGKYHLALSDDSATSGIEGTGMSHASTVAGWPTVRGILTNPYARTAGLEIGLPPTADGFEPGYWNYYWVDTVDNSGSFTPTQVTGTHLTQRTRSKAKAWIRSAQEPWCCWLAFNSAHSPYGGKTGDPDHSGLDPTGSTLGTYTSYSNIAGNNWDCFRAGIEHLDKELGQLESDLGADVMANTLIIVMGDNGIPGGQVFAQMQSDEAASLSSPYSVLTTEQVKSSVYSGGVRNWMVVRGPSHLVGGSLGRTCSVPVDAVDVFETIRHAARVAVGGKTTDGVSLVPVLQSAAAEATHGRTFHYTENFAPNGSPFNLTSGGSTTQNTGYEDADHEWDRAYAMQVGGTWYKLIRRFDGAGGDTEEFFDLDADPYELADLAGNPSYDTARAMVGAALDALLATAE